MCFAILFKRHLGEFAETINTADTSSDIVFRELLNFAFDHYGLERSKLVTRFSVSKGTVSKWCSGLALPHRNIRPYITQWIKDEALLILSTL